MCQHLLQLGHSQMLAILRFSNSTGLDVSKEPLAVVAILFSRETFGIMTGDNALLCIIIPVLPVLGRQISGLSTWILLIVSTLTMATGATLLVLNLTVLDVGMNTKAS